MISSIIKYTDLPEFANERSENDYLLEKITKLLANKPDYARQLMNFIKLYPVISRYHNVELTGSALFIIANGIDFSYKRIETCDLDFVLYHNYVKEKDIFAYAEDIVEELTNLGIPNATVIDPNGYSDNNKIVDAIIKSDGVDFLLINTKHQTVKQRADAITISSETWKWEKEIFFKWYAEIVDILLLPK